MIENDAAYTLAVPQTETDAAYTLLMLAVYMFPTIVAMVQKRRHTAAIATLNVLLGWTGLGWVIALIWAAMNQPRQPKTA
jgi:hypothetical protein